MSYTHLLQVTISYVDGLEPRDSRQQSLRQRYCFDCHCDRCCHPSPARDDFLDAVSADTGGKASPSVAHVELALQPAIDQGAQLFLVEVQQSSSRNSCSPGLEIGRCDHSVSAIDQPLCTY